MDIPHFISNPVTETELETAQLLSHGMNMNEVAKARQLSREAIKTHTSALRFKFHATNITDAICKMIALGYLPADGLMHQLPEHWQKYVVVYQKPAPQKQNSGQ